MAMNHVWQVPQRTLLVRNLMLSIDHRDEDYLRLTFYQVWTGYQECIERAYLRVKIYNAEFIFVKSL